MTGSLLVELCAGCAVAFSVFVIFLYLAFAVVSSVVWIFFFFYVCFIELHFTPVKVSKVSDFRSLS